MFQMKNRFESISKANPLYSSYLCFAETIRGQDINEQTVRRWFYILVDPEDYAPSEVRGVLRHLVSLSKPSLSGNPSQTTS